MKSTMKKNILGICTALALVSPVLASEDAVPYMYGGAVNYEQMEMGHAQMGDDLDFESGDLFGADTFDISEDPVEAKTPAQNSTPLPAANQESEKAPQEVPMLQSPAQNPPPPVQQLPLNSDSLSENFTNPPSTPQKEDVPELMNDSQTPSAQKVEAEAEKKTWIDTLSDSQAINKIKNISSGTESLEDLVDKARTTQNSSQGSNASVFDISGIMLRMNVGQVDDIMRNRGFKKTYEKYQIPNFIKWRNEEYCRNSGVVGYERLEACVIQKAKKDKHQYIYQTKYNKYDTKEEIEVWFTSNFTENKAYKIEYTSMASAITGNSPKAMYLYNIKVYDFWRRINRKYGVPDNKQAVTWGMDAGKPYLRAKTGHLVLEDPMFRELDYTRMSREDQRYLVTDLYSF